MRIWILTVALLGMSCPAVAQTKTTQFNPSGPHAVGLKVVEQYDYSRSYRGPIDPLTGKVLSGETARPIQTVIWYPAVKGLKPALTVADYVRIGAVDDDFSLTSAERTAREAKALQKAPNGPSPEQMKAELNAVMLAHRDEAAEPGRFPVVVYAASFGNPAVENADLCEYLASHGYIVIASPSVGRATRTMTSDLEGAETQSADIEFLIGYAHTLPQADTSHVAVIGYSWGGLSNVLAAAKDSRIDALVSLDGSVRYFPDIVKQATYFTPLRNTAPLLFIAAPTADVEEQPKSFPNSETSPLNQMKYADVYVVKMAPMQHWYFNTVFGQRLYGWWGEYSKNEVTAATNWMETYVLRFLDAYLKQDDKSRAFLDLPATKTGAPAHLFTTRATHPQGPAPTRNAFAAELDKQGFDKAPAVYQTFKARGPDFDISVYELVSWGNDLMEGGDLAKAISILKLATELYPGDAVAFQVLGQAYTKHGDKALAIASLRQSLVLNPKNNDAKWQLEALGVQP